MRIWQLTKNCTCKPNGLWKNQCRYGHFLRIWLQKQTKLSFQDILPDIIKG